MVSLQLSPDNRTMTNIRVDGNPNQLALEICLLISEAYKEIYRQHGDKAAWDWKETMMSMLRPRGFWEISLDDVKTEPNTTHEQ